MTPDRVQQDQHMEATHIKTRNHPGQILLYIALFLLVLTLTLTLTGWVPMSVWYTAWIPVLALGAVGTLMKKSPSKRHRLRSDRSGI